ncbi:hypothetical protein M0R72_00740 [Candidatus Pacearchaeota archaeon]|jgi:hypothetical protein|nr:hypothetical protein [Candidatus Pacearchaeota archaeon]
MNVTKVSSTLYIAHVEVHVPNQDSEAGWVLDRFEGEPCPSGFDSWEQLKARLLEAGFEYDPSLVKLTRYDLGTTKYLFLI